MFFSAESLQNISEIDRDELLQLDDRDLADHCTVDVFVGKGPGGQHRNRNYTAVRVVFKYDRSFAAEDCTSRSQQQNLSGALNKLRIMLAIFWRKKTDANIAYTHLNNNNRLYAFELAKLLDAVTDAKFDHKLAAEKSGVSNTFLLKELARDHRVWEIFQKSRQALDLSELKKPGN